MSVVHPVEILRAGCEILDQIMAPYGFRFVPGASGNSNFGLFASGDYVRGDRRLELHFRYSLGLVTYHIGDVSVSHDAYLRALTKDEGGNQYPGFSAEPLDGFRHLAHDLQKFCGDFLFGGGEILLAVTAEVKSKEELEKKISRDERTRNELLGLLREKKYREVLQRLESFQHPELMTGAEKKMLEIARRYTKED